MTRRMIMSRTPLRITFTGGGTDIPEYFMNYGNGAVINATINKYIYITVNEKFDKKIRVSYSTTEIVENVDEIKHPVVREALNYLNIREKIEIVSISDIPSNGTGLGSSSTFTVGLLNALHAYKGEFASSSQLAREAVHIERNILKEEGGLQDQYSAAFGGLNFMEFYKENEVNVTPIIMPGNTMDELQKHLLLLYTNMERRSNGIHQDQRSKVSSLRENYRKMSELSHKLREDLNKGDYLVTGSILNENWNEKKKLSSRISMGEIDALYERAMEKGAKGGKLIGSGGGGFLMFFADPKYHKSISESLRMPVTPFRIVHRGSGIIFVGD